MKRFLKENKGITLVALVITIIILIILAGVTFSVVLGQNGLIEKSKDGVTRYKDEATRERIQLAVINASMGDNGVTENSLRTALNNEFGENGFILQKDETSGNFIITVDSVVVEVTPTGSIITSNTNGGGSGNGNNGGNGGQQQEDNGPYARYSIGDEVTVTYNGKTESFYVIEASNSNSENVTLLSKFCLKNSELVQAPYEEDYSEIYYDFTPYDFDDSEEDIEYWKDDYIAYFNVASKPTRKFNINNVENNSSYDYVTNIAKKYATSMGGTDGRLLTYEEVDYLLTGGENSDSISRTIENCVNPAWAKIIYGYSRQFRDEYYLDYWLASARDPEYVNGEIVTENYGYIYYVAGAGHWVGSTYEDTGYHYNIGVRPVITVAKTQVQPKEQTQQVGYTAGQEIKIIKNGNAEHFYILEVNQDSYTVIAKYTLNDSTHQFNPTEGGGFSGPSQFSNSAYWADEYVTWYTQNSENHDTEFNVNNISGNESGDVMTWAQEYAEYLNATSGRLLTYEELQRYTEIENGEYKYPKLAQAIWGHSDELQFYYEKGRASEEGFNYWLASMYFEEIDLENSYITPEEIEYQFYYVEGDQETVYTYNYPSSYDCCVRPVLTIPKNANIQIVKDRE